MRWIFVYRPHGSRDHEPFKREKEIWSNQNFELLGSGPMRETNGIVGLKLNVRISQFVNFEHKDPKWISIHQVATKR